MKRGLTGAGRHRPGALFLVCTFVTLVAHTSPTWAPPAADAAHVSFHFAQRLSIESMRHHHGATDHHDTAVHDSVPFRHVHGADSIPHSHAPVVDVLIVAAAADEEEKSGATMAAPQLDLHLAAPSTSLPVRQDPGPAKPGGFDSHVPFTPGDPPVPPPRA